VEDAGLDAGVDQDVEAPLLLVHLGAHLGLALRREVPDLLEGHVGDVAALGVGLDVGDHQRGELRRRVGRGRGHGGRAGLLELVDARHHDAQQQLLLGAEVVIQVGRAHVRAARDVADRRAVVALLGHHLDAGLQQRSRAVASLRSGGRGR
jgi:hypothetical protein